MPFHPLITASALLPLLAAVPISVAQDGAQQASTAEVIDLSPDAHNRMTVPVRIGAHGPFDFIIDTGAERTVLSRTVASRLGLASATTATLVGVAGTQVVDMVEVEEINLGRRSFYGLMTPLLDARHIGADGIIGLDSLQDQRVLLDFAAKRMAIDDAAALGGNRGYDIVVRARSRSGQLIMANALVDGVKTQVVIDTGSDTSIGNPALHRALTRRRAAEKTQLVSVTGQEIAADVMVAGAIELEGLKLGNTVLAFADAPAFHKLGLGRRPAMLLGMDQLRLFRRVAIDFSSKRILFDLPGSPTLSRQASAL